MGIEFVTPDLVNINGYTVEIRDTREPDLFNVVAAGDNTVLQQRYAVPTRDVDFDLTLNTSFRINVPTEVIVYQQIPRFIDLARRSAEERAVSYRDFKVGASAFAVTDDGSRGAYLFGANNTPYQGAPKDCAEMDILKKVDERGLDWIVGLAIFGPPDSGTVNRVQTNTLHPCDLCRGLLDQAPSVRDDTLFMMGSPDGALELMLKPDLMQVHRTDS